MTKNEDQTIQKLIQTFTQFDKLDWEKKTIEGFKPSEIRVLTCIKQKIQSTCEIKVSEISKHLNLRMPSVTPILNKLEQDGLITRRIDEHDRRVVLVTLTTEGESLADVALDYLYETFASLQESIGLEDSKELIRILTNVNQFFKEKQN